MIFNYTISLSNIVQGTVAPQLEFGSMLYDWIEHNKEKNVLWPLHFSVASSIFNLVNRNMLLEEICTGYAQMYAKTKWEMCLKGLRDHSNSI
jgi:hypothetical protein